MLGDAAQGAARRPGGGTPLHARTTTFAADPSRIDQGIRFVRDVLLPAVMGREGCAGLSFLCDRGSGRCFVTTTWTSVPAMRATAGMSGGMIPRTAEAMGSGEVRVDEWEVAVLHRAFMAGDGTRARVIWLRCDPAVLQQALDDLPLTLLPRIDATEGFCSLGLYVDRPTGLCVMTGVYEDLHTLEVSRDQAEVLRGMMADHMGLEITDVAEFELAVHSLGIPQTPRHPEGRRT